MKHRALVTVAFGSVLALVAAWLWKRPAAVVPVAPPASVSRPLPTASGQAVPLATAAPVPPPAATVELPATLRDPARPLAEVYAELLRLAENGSVEAMYELGVRQLPCKPQNLQTLQRMIQILAEMPAANATAPQRESRADYIAGLQRSIDACAIVSADAPTGLDWLERAGHLGHGPAQLQYARMALSDFVTEQPDQVVAQIEEVMRRRGVLRHFMAEALARCVPGAFSTQESVAAYLFDRDDTRAYRLAAATAAAAGWREVVAANEPPQVAETWKEIFERRAKELDEVSRTVALRQGEAMFSHCAPR